MLDQRQLYQRGIKKTIDWWVVACYVLLSLFGIMNIYASVHSSEPNSIFDLTCNSGKQIIWTAGAYVIALLVLFLFNPHIWEALAPPAYAIVQILLVAVIFLSSDVKGSHSWFKFGPVSFQPAELSKITTSLFLALLISRQNFKMTELKHFAAVAAAILIPMATIVLESETGSALVYCGFIFMLYREGLTGWLLSLAGMVVLLFILTLKFSPYTSLMALTILVSLCCSTYRKRFVSWLTKETPLLLFLSFLPSMWHSLINRLVPGADLAIADMDPSVTDTVLKASHWSFLLAFKPMYLLAALLAFIIIKAMIRAYEEKSLALWSAVGALFIGIALTFSASFVFKNVLQDHQRTRIEVLLGMKEDLAGAGYNVHQSMVAIGSGGVVGKGYLQGTQTTYGFVPEQSTDFIFCTVGEEWGFLGCAFVIILYVIMIWRLIRDADDCREVFTRVYGYCVAGILFMHLFINIGMTIGIMPVIGIPLPLFSYGGSSMWAFTTLIFIFLALYRQEKKYF